MIRYHARWVVPISRAPVEHGVVVEHEGRILYAGPDSSAPPGDDHDLGDVALLPGLVNTHTHLELTVMRGFLEDLEFWPWITTLTASRRAVLDEASMLDSARLGVAEGLLAGVTTYADTCSSGVALQAMRELGVRGVMYQEVFGPDPAQCDASIAELREKVAKLREQETDLARVGVSPHAPYSVSDALFRATAALAAQHRLPVAIHVAESEAESRYVRDGEGPFADNQRGRGIPVAPRGSTPIRVLAATSVLEARPLLIHCVRVDDDDIRLIANHDCAVAHCPSSNAKLGHGIAPLTRFLDARIRVGLGSDSVASNNKMDMLEEARLATLMQRARLARPDTLPAPAALELATLGGARALGLEREIGTLDPGKQADLAAFPLSELRASPCFDPAVALVFAASGRPATFVTVAGHVLVRDGRLVSEHLVPRERIASLANRLCAWRDLRRS